MQVPLELAFHGIEQSDTIESMIRDRVDGLAQYFDGIISCRVVAEAPHRAGADNHIKNVRVRIDLAVPGRELIAESEPTEDPKNMDDIYFAVDQAFDRMERQLNDFQNELSDHADSRFPTEPNGIVSSINREEEFGYIESMDGREIYFQPQSLDGIDFDDLEQGDEVKVVVGSGLDSPQPVARRVRAA